MSDSSLNKSALPAAVGASARHAVNVIACIALIPFILSRLGMEDYGLWILVTSTVGMLSLCDAGLTTSTVKYVADCRGQRDTHKRNRLVSTILCLYVVAAIVLSVAACAICGTFNGLFAIPEGQQDKASLLVAVIAAKLIVGFPLSIFHGLLFGERKIGAINLVKLFATLLYAAAVWTTLNSGHGVIALAVVNVLVFVLEHAAYVGLCCLFVPDLRISPRLFDTRILREVASFSGYALLANIAVLVLLRIDPLIIKLFLPMSAVALYAIAIRVAEQVLLIIKQFVNAFTPLLAELNGAQGASAATNTWLTCTRWAIAGVLLLSSAAMICAEELLTLWIGPDFSAAAPVLVLLLMAIVVGVAQECASSSLAMTGLHRFNSLAVSGGAGLNLLLSLIFIQYWGLVGVAFASMISVALVGVGIVIAKACVYYRVSWKRYFRSSIQPSLTPLLLEVIVIHGTREYWPPDSLLGLALVIVPGMCVFLASGWFCILSRHERGCLHECLTSRVQAACRVVTRHSSSHCPPGL